MKTIKWLGTTLLIVASVGIWATAQSADYVWVERSTYGSTPPELSGPEKTALGAAINNAFGIAGAALDKLDCNLTPGDLVVWRCKLYSDVTVSDDQYFILRKQGVIPAGAATVVKSATAELEAAYHAEFSAILNSVHSKLLTDTYAFKFWRDADVPTTVYSDIFYFNTGSAALHRSQDVAGVVAIQIGVVE